MREVFFEGVQYKDIDIDSQYAFKAMGIYSFRYFPKTKVWMASEVTAQRFGIDKFYKIGAPGSGPGVVYINDRAKDVALYKRIISGEKVVSDNIRIFDDSSNYRITLAVLEEDDSGTPTVVAGMVEEFDKQLMQSAFVQMLSDDYASVYFVDFDKNQVTSYKMSGIIESKYGSEMVKQPPYETIISAYINNEVVEEERAEMLEITSYENLDRQFRSKNTYRHEYRVLRNDKNLYFRFKAVKVNQGEKLTRMVIGFADVSRDKMDKIEKLAFFDQVTLGNNYNYFSETLKSENRAGYIVSLDIRDFKVVNDACGISKGDFILQKTSVLLNDTIGRCGFFGHVNSDHFVMFLPDMSEQQVIQIMSQIDDGIAALVKLYNIPKIGTYYGASLWKPGDRIQLKFSEANTAKHKIKDCKDINYGFFRDEDMAAAIERKKFEDAFDVAIAQQQFEVWYQPKYSPEDKLLTGAEALIRWRLPSGELVSPGKFIPIYERNGMIRQLDEYVFTQVCKQQKEWLAKIGRVVPVSVNLSRASLFYNRIVDEYKEICDGYGIKPELLPLEITESAAISNSDIKDLANRFFDAGFPLQVDDFGTGYSSLATLNLMKFDTLKLDKSLIDYIGEFGGDRLIKHTVALAKDMGLRVTAEGVEKPEQVRFLKQVDCDNIQGYVYSRPIPVEDFGKVLSTSPISSEYGYTAC